MQTKNNDSLADINILATEFNWKTKKILGHDKSSIGFTNIRKIKNVVDIYQSCARKEQTLRLNVAFACVSRSVILNFCVSCLSYVQSY